MNETKTTTTINEVIRKFSEDFTLGTVVEVGDSQSENGFGVIVDRCVNLDSQRRDGFDGSPGIFFEVGGSTDPDLNGLRVYLTVHNHIDHDGDGGRPGIPHRGGGSNLAGNRDLSRPGDHDKEVDSRTVGFEILGDVNGGKDFICQVIPRPNPTDFAGVSWTSGRVSKEIDPDFIVPFRKGLDSGRWESTSTRLVRGIRVRDILDELIDWSSNTLPVKTVDRLVEEVMKEMN